MSNKKNIVIVLLAPFAISLLGISAINFTFNTIDTDILDINWNYNDVEPFKLVDQEYRLEATALNNMNYPIPNYSLVWKVENINKEESNHASIVSKGNISYLKPISEGEVNITVSNDKGNIFKRMKGIVYENAAIIINPKIKSSQANINQTLHVGEYNLQNEVKPTHHNVTEQYNITIIPEIFKDKVVMTHSDNISVSNDYQSLSIVGSGDAYMKLEFSDPTIGKPQQVNFNIVKDGINVYNYHDLLLCSNKSKDGEKIVLRTSFESNENLYVYDDNNNIIGKKLENTDSFGSLNNKTKMHSFADEVYRFETTSNHEYIDQWNEFAKTNNKYASISKEVLAGLHIQKDFYGNGYTINFHNLTYPYGKTTMTSGNQTYAVPTLTKENLFRGPLPFYMLGDPTGMPIVGVYGQDNIGMYVDGDNITVDDINIKNCDFGDNLANLDYAGTTLETFGNNINIQNSRLSNGRNVMRACSSDVLINNCLLSYSRNFLLTAGSNKSIEVDGSKRFSYTYGGRVVNTTIDKYLTRDGKGDEALSKYLLGDIDEEVIRILKGMQQGFDSVTPLEFDGNVRVKDTMFYTSGITSIALESLFNGPFLYNCSPSVVYDLLSSINIEEGKSIMPFAPTGIASCSYPIKLDISGKTRFYDYKDAEKYDLSGLIFNNIGPIVNAIDPNRDPITIDDIFPLKSLINAQSTGYNYQGKINMPLAYYGGGPNLSQVSIHDLEESAAQIKEINVDFFEQYLKLGPTDLDKMSGLRNLVLKCVTIVTGIDPFKFTLASDYLLGKTPQISTLIENNKGGI